MIDEAERASECRPHTCRPGRRPALLTAGLLPTRENGMHALRHFYASVLLDAGESVRALAEYLGTPTRGSRCVSTRT